TYDGDWVGLALVALIFGIVNAFIKPLLQLLTCPLIILTLGLFTLVINALMLQLTSSLAGTFNLDFHVDNFGAAFWGGLVISIVSIILSIFLGGEDKKRQERRERY
ncbi:MAG: phage holin family protein, partial [Anaerolineae bacterium]|nr:phage holin family protein [Anaerolineae bacterium]